MTLIKHNPIYCKYYAGWCFLKADYCYLVGGANCVDYISIFKKE